MTIGCSLTLELTVERLQKVWRAALDAELQRAKQQLEWYDQVILHLQSPSCKKQTGSTQWASLKPWGGTFFPFYWSSMVQAEGGRKGGKKKTEKHENYPIKCINSWSLLLVTFKYPTYPWPKETVSSSFEWCPSPWRKRHRTVNHKLAPVFFIKKQNTIVKILTWRYLWKQKCLLTCHQKPKQIYFYMSYK